MDVIDRFKSGLFVRRLNVNPAYNPNINPVDDTFSGIVKDVRHSVFPGQSTISSRSPVPCLPSPVSQETPLPLLSVSIEVDINGRFCNTKITQKFTNACADAAQDARYLFPIYDGSVVTFFQCWIGPDRLLEGAVKPKEVARQDFQQAVSRHKAAVLIEEVTPEILETNLGNIPAETTVKVVIAYTHLLKVDNSTGGLVLSIPTSVAPRYGTPPQGYVAGDSLPTEGLRVNIQVSMPASIRKMESGTHPISVEIGAVSHQSFQTFAAGAFSENFDPSKARATLADRSAVLHKDFILSIVLSSSREFMQSQAIATSQRESPGQSTVAVTISPGNLFLQNVNTEDFDGEIIFMADRSGSMQEMIPSLIDVMNVFLRSLPQKCSFNIASFGSRFSWLWPFSQAYSQEDLDTATRHVQSFKADFGGTEILTALQSVMEHHDRRVAVPTNVILLTDGEVWDVDRVIQFAKTTASNRELNVRFFALGIGDRVSHRLVEGIGQQGGGCAEVVTESSAGAWQKRVIHMLKAALTPSRLQCEVDIGQLPLMDTDIFDTGGLSGYKLRLPPCIQAPHHIPMLNTFSQFSLYYMLDCELGSLPESVTITAVTDKGEKLIAQLPLQKSAKKPGLHYLAAKALMNDYETGQSWMHTAGSSLKSNEPPVFDEILKQEAQRFGQQWSITSKWTSFVAIDRDTAYRHEISLCKADSVDVSELTRPRKFQVPVHSQLGLPFMHQPTRSFQSLGKGYQGIPRKRGRPGIPASAGLLRSLSRPGKRSSTSGDTNTSSDPPFDNSSSAGISIPDLLSTAPMSFGDEGVDDEQMYSIPIHPSYSVPPSHLIGFPGPAGPAGQSNTFSANGPPAASVMREPGYLHQPQLQADGSRNSLTSINTQESHNASLNSLSTGKSPTQSAEPGITSISEEYDHISPFDESSYCSDVPYSTGSAPVAQANQVPEPSQTGHYAQSQSHYIDSIPNLTFGMTGSEDYPGWGAPEEYPGWGAPVTSESDPCAIAVTPPKDSPQNSLTLSLPEILSTQAADGKFRLLRSPIKDSLMAQFNNIVVYRRWGTIKLVPVTSQTNDPTSIELNIHAVVYITNRHADSKGLWELQIEKARRWILKKLAKHRGPVRQRALFQIREARYLPESYLKRMEELLRAELVPELREGSASGLIGESGNTSSA